MIFFPSKIFIKVHMNSHSKREVLEMFNISEENQCYFLISPPVSQLLNWFSEKWSRVKYHMIY